MNLKGNQIVVNLIYIFYMINLAYCYAPIDVKYDFKAHQIHRIDTINILAYTLLLIATIVTIWIFKIRRFKYVHETSLTLVYGLIAGALIRYVGDQTTEFTYLRVIPSDLKLDNSSLFLNQTIIFQKTNNQNELSILTKSRNITSLIRNHSNASSERLNNDYPLNVNQNLKNFKILKDLANLTTSNLSVASNATSLNHNEKDETKIDLKLTTIKLGINSTLLVDSTTQEPRPPITENSLKPTIPLNKLNNSSIKPTLSTNLNQTNQDKNTTKIDKIIPKKIVNSKEVTKELKNRKAN